MKTRKIVLLAACGILLCICILQAVLKTGDTAKVFTLAKEPQQLEIICADNSYTIKMVNGVWVCGSKEYPAAESSVNGMLSAMSSIKVLDKVASSTNEANLIRYDLVDEKKITVNALYDGKIVRTITIGKSSTANTQDYITIDNGKEVYLASGGLRNLFSKTADEIRSKTVVTLDQNQITSITVKEAGKEWTVSRSGSGENLMWFISLPDSQVDGKKAGDWFNSFASVVTTVWHDTDDLDGQKLRDVEIMCGNKKVCFTLFNSKNDNQDIYYASSSETPYYFELPSYVAAKFQKNAEDLIQ